MEDEILKKIVLQKDIKHVCSAMRNDAKTIVFTNGCFDILHYGHAYYLAKAKENGDRLIVGLNSDESVKKLKGENRPINNERQRAYLLASLLFVDVVVIFDEDTPEKIINLIIPDVLVKGGDYKKENIVGAELVENNGGRVCIIDFVEGLSSTELIKKQKNNI